MNAITAGRCERRFSLGISVTWGSVTGVKIIFGAERNIVSFRRAVALLSPPRPRIKSQRDGAVYFRFAG